MLKDQIARRKKVIEAVNGVQHETALGCLFKTQQMQLSNQKKSKA